MIAPPGALVDLLKPWSDFYGHSKLAETIVLFVHVGALLLGGGIAVASDRATLRAISQPLDDRMRQRRELSTVHRWVIGSLVAIAASGLVLLAADLETFWDSPIYWTKMALVVALLVNGLLMTRAEATLDREDDAGTAGWRTLRRTALASLGLWFSITALGIALVNYS